ncbi:MAG: TIM barrel protein [bacterium]
MAGIRFGPSGLGGKKDAIKNLEKMHEAGLKACEIAFTYGVYLKKDDAIEIGKSAEELGILLSIHAPYFVNLNSAEKAKVEASKKRILACCEAGHYLAGKENVRIVFHPGYYGKMEKEEAYENIKNIILEIKEKVDEKRWRVDLCVETMGKVNVFGSIEEISKLVRDTGIMACIDFAHILARYGKYEFDMIKKGFKGKKWHCHFSGIVYGEKGEKHHKLTEKNEWEEVLNFLEKLNKDVVIVNESPDPFGDAVAGLKIWEGMR